MSLNFHKSYRFKIVFSFLIVITITIQLFFIYNYFNSKTEESQKLTTSIYELESSFSNNEKYFLAFLINGYKNPKFYKTYSEDNIDTYILNIVKQKDSLERISKKLNETKILKNTELIERLTNKFNSLLSFSNQIKKMRHELGYHDYGKIGMMRDIIHKVEASKNTALDKLLQLRRHEKDFLLRSDSVYIKQFNALANDITKNIDNPNSLITYQELFNEVSVLYYKVGFTAGNKDGLYYKISQENQSILKALKQIKKITSQEIDKKNANTSIFIKSSISAILLFIVILVMYLSQVLTRDLKRLKQSMYTFIKSGFKEQDSYSIENSKILEIDFLYKAYGLLKKNLIKNIDDLKLTIEELEKTTAYKSSFLAKMSHEIRTPLNGIIGILNLLDQTHTTKDQKELLEIANHSSSHLLGLINVILDYSKISAGKLELEYAPINVEQDLNKLVRIFEFQAQEKNIDIVYSYDKTENTSEFVLADSLRLNQIIINLLSNAVKFTKEGHVKLEVKQECLNDDIDRFLFSVTDTGIGMADGMAEKIFQAFEQEDLSTTRKFGGTGLGLAISNELAKLMESELKFSTIKGLGSEFYFELDLKKTSKNVSLIAINNINTKLNQETKPIKVLVVDDNKMNQKVLGFMLSKFNIEINYANNGIEAIELFKTNHYEMVFMDIQMPVMDGLTATANIKESEAFISNPIPIIAVSANAYSEDRKEAIKAGIDDFISKPIEIKNVKDLLIKYSLNPVKKRKENQLS